MQFGRFDLPSRLKSLTGRLSGTKRPRCSIVKLVRMSRRLVFVAYSQVMAMVCELEPAETMADELVATETTEARLSAEEEVVNVEFIAARDEDPAQLLVAAELERLELSLVGFSAVVFWPTCRVIFA